MHYLHLVMKKEVATTEFMVIYLIYWHRVSKCCLIKLDNATPLPASQAQHLFDSFTCKLTLA
jgi:hypothetical protein